MVMINPVGSGEAGLQRRDQSGEQGGDESIAASVDVSQVNMEERGAQAEGLDTAPMLEEGRKRQAARQSDLTKRIMEAANEIEQEDADETADDWQTQEGRRHRKDKNDHSNAEKEFRPEKREGDWYCKGEMCKFYNFAMRTQCRRCSRDKEGRIVEPQQSEGYGQTRKNAWAQSPGERLRRSQEGMGAHKPYVRKMMILTVNLVIDGKAKVWPKNSEVGDIMKQAGLKLNEVQGLGSYAGYLEVAMLPGAASGVLAQRETPKAVNERIMISSIREKGINRKVKVTVYGVPFDTPDETILQYVELFAEFEAIDRKVWWERISQEEDETQGGELKGKWSGNRSMMVTLKKEVGNIPTFHYVAGVKLKIRVQGRLNCSRCLKTVGECIGQGSWKKCAEEAQGEPRGDWKKAQRDFLKRGGWSEEKQKKLEDLIAEDANKPGDSDEEDREAQEARENEGKAEEEKEGLHTQLGEDRVCGGLLLRNYQEEEGDKANEEQEILYVLQKLGELTEEELKATEGATVTITRPERGRKGTMNVKIMAKEANQSLRKIWKNIEEPCRQEGVKRYMLEASSPATPKKQKPKSEFRKTRALVRKISREAAEEKEKNKALEEEKDMKRLEDEGLLKKAENNKEVSEDVEVEEILSKDATESMEINTNEKDEKQAEDTQEDTEDTTMRDTVVVKNQGKLSERKKTKKKYENDPEPHMKRCGEGCEGCRKKCAEQGKEDCTGCVANKRKKDNKAPCQCRLKCLKEKPKAQASKDQKEKLKAVVARESITPGKNKDDIQEGVSTPKEGVKGGGDVLKEVSKIEERDMDSNKRYRESSGTPEDNKKQMPMSGIPTLKLQAGKESKLSQ